MNSVGFYIEKCKPSKFSFNRSCWVYKADGLGSLVLLNCLVCGLRGSAQGTKSLTIFQFPMPFDKRLHYSNHQSGVHSFWHLSFVVSTWGGRERKTCRWCESRTRWNSDLFFKALISDIYKASHTMTGAFASISKSLSCGKAASFSSLKIVETQMGLLPQGFSRKQYLAI